MTATLPEGIRSTRLPGGSVVALEPWLTPFTELVREHGTLYDWASSQPQPRALRGRAPVYVAQLPDGGPSVVVRHAWHGGSLAPITQDVFRRPTRAPLEMARSQALHRLGIPTTEVLGYALYDAAMGLVRVDVVTRYVSGTADLGMILAGLAPSLDCSAALDATLELLQRLAVHGVVHPDLNVKNILLQVPEGKPPRALVIDIDVVQLGVVPPARAMARNVARLTRSLRKWKRQFGCELADQHIAAFADAAMERVRGASSPGATAIASAGDRT